MTVTVLGIRHHGPGSARSVEHALRELKPDAVLVEGPPEAEPLLPLATHEEMRPPVALLAYAADAPGRAVFYPFARFSPEWQAIRYALSEQLTLRMIDLPVTRVLAEPPGHERPTATPVPDDGASADRERDEGREEADRLRSDPIAWLAEAAGHGDSERFWEDVVEHRHGEQAFAAIAEAMAALRERAEQDGVLTDNNTRVWEARREAQMRQAIRLAVKDSHERIAVVCGAWHTPALTDIGPANADTALLKGLPRRKVVVTWVPWTYDRLSTRSGYGAGIGAPGWYDHLYQHRGEQVLVRWLTKTARLLRDEDVGISSAHVIEAVRLAEALATLRERPLAGLPEVNEATRAVLGEGADAALSLVHEKLVVGDVLGRVPAEAPTVPLQADLEREQRRLRLRPAPGERALDLDLRKDTDRARSRLLHRLTLLEIPWGEQDAVRGARGTFHELWKLRWQPEYVVGLVEASRYGSTLVEAATALVRKRATAEAPLVELTTLIEAALLADLPVAVAAAMAAFQERTAVGADTSQLMEALSPLARALRYGNVRATDARQVKEVVDGLVARIVVGLPLTAAALDDDAASQLTARIDAVDAAIAVLERAELGRPWRGALARLAERADAHGQVTGRCTRILHDAGEIEPGELERRMGLVLSVGNDPVAGASWIEGFLSSSGLVLIHDQTLLRLLDGWLGGVDEEIFTRLVPVLRRTFSTFPAGERRQIGERVKRLEGPGAPPPLGAGEELDRSRAALVVPVIRLVLGAKEDTQ